MASHSKALIGKTAVITGCNRGIGKAILESYAQNGANIFACLRKENEEFSKLIEQLSKKNSIEIIPVYFDSRNLEELKNAVKFIKDAKKKIDVLVNNSGVGYNALFQMSSLDKLKEVFDVNFVAPFVFTQYITKFMVRQRSGSIITISSTTALDANEGKSIYGASKAALICMTQVIAAELKEFGIRANSIAPGLTDTDMMAWIPEKIVVNSIERQEIAKPEDIAEKAVYLASDESAHISGHVFRVEAGKQ